MPSVLAAAAALATAVALLVPARAVRPGLAGARPDERLRGPLRGAVAGRRLLATVAARPGRGRGGLGLRRLRLRRRLLGRFRRRRLFLDLLDLGDHVLLGERRHVA